MASSSAATTRTGLWYISIRRRSVCGNDSSSKKIVLQLAEQIGFESIDAGPFSVARLLEPLAMLWIHLAYKTDMGINFAFGILRR